MQTVYGVQLEDIPHDATPLEAIVIVKALDENGEHCLYRRGSEGLSPWETIGMLQIALDAARDTGGYEWQEPEAE